MTQPTAHKKFVAALKKLAGPGVVKEVSRFFRVDPNADSSDNKFLGVSIGKIFPVAKQFTDMPLEEIELLLEKKIAPERRKALFDTADDFPSRRKRNFFFNHKDTKTLRHKMRKNLCP